jgi:single-strand DNA-binding protein
MQNITISGYLSRDAEAKTTQRGDNVTSWNVPVKQGFGDNEQTNWYRVSIWGRRAEYAAKARKGDYVTVTGELRIGEYNGKIQLEISSYDFGLVKMQPREGAGSDTGARQQAPSNAGDYDDLDDSGVPF